MSSTKTLIQKYYDSFNKEDLDGFLDCLSDDVIHDINQGSKQKGKQAFSKFMEHMSHCYKETAHDLIILVSEDGNHASSKFIITGTYMATDNGLPEAKQQNYQLPVGAFFEIKDHKIVRVTNYYNMKDWLNQVTSQ